MASFLKEEGLKEIKEEETKEETKEEIKEETKEEEKEATKEIKKEEESKLPTITIAIVSHGMDLIKEKLSIDSNVRIYSRAGQTLCFGVINSNPMNFVEELYYTNERMYDEDKRTSYEMLQAVAEHYKMPEHDKEFVNIIMKEVEKNPKPTKHTLKTIAKKKHSQIYTPFYDHLYIFTDNSGPFNNNNQITVLETKNHTSRSNIDYRDIINLAKKRYAIQAPLYWMRVDIEEKRFINFFKKFHMTALLPESELNFLEKIDLEDLRKKYANNPSELERNVNDYLKRAKLKRYSRKIYENRYLIFEDGFVSEIKLLREFENPDSKLYEYIQYEDDKQIIRETMDEIKRLESDKSLSFSKRKEKRREFYNEHDDIIPGVKLSTIIDFLKSEGFVIINIIDFSCRTVSEEVSKDRITILNEQQQMIADEIDPTRGGTTRKRIRRKRKRKTRRRL